MMSFPSGYFEEDYKPNNSTQESKINMHIDIDMFYAQVEILLNSELKGKPLVVGNPRARITKRGVVLTSSYEARKFGVKSGMPMIEAIKLCPQVEIVKPRYNLYRQISSKVMDILKSYNLPLKITSIDEAYMDVSSIVDNYDDANKFAIEIKSKIKTSEGLTVSIGIGPTLTIAKIASDYNKPDGIKLVKPNELDAFFSDLPLIKIPGIGKKSYERLKARGYSYGKDLMNYSYDEIIQLLGNTGNYIYRVMHAKTTNTIGVNHGKRKSISNESTFIGKPGDINYYMQKVYYLFDRSFNRLLKGNWYTHTVNIKIRFNDFKTITRSKSIDAFTQDRDILREITINLIKPYLKDKRGLRLIGIGFSNIKHVKNKYVPLEEFF